MQEKPSTPDINGNAQLKAITTASTGEYNKHNERFRVVVNSINPMKDTANYPVFSPYWSEYHNPSRPQALASDSSLSKLAWSNKHIKNHINHCPNSTSIIKIIRSTSKHNHSTISNTSKQSNESATNPTPKPPQIPLPKPSIQQKFTPKKSKLEIKPHNQQPNSNRGNPNSSKATYSTCLWFQNHLRSIVKLRQRPLLPLRHRRRRHDRSQSSPPQSHIKVGEISIANNKSHHFFSL